MLGHRDPKRLLSPPPATWIAPPHNPARSGAAARDRPEGKAGFTRESEGEEDATDAARGPARWGLGPARNGAKPGAGTRAELRRIAEGLSRSGDRPGGRSEGDFQRGDVGRDA